MKRSSRLVAVSLLGLVLTASAGLAQTRITSPAEQLGFAIGDDYQLANYTQLTEYWQKLDDESDRMTLEEIGRTAERRPQWMAIITSPDNHERLDHYQDISRRLALAEDLTDEEARALAIEGKVVVWIDGGLHATEVLGAHQLMEFVYQMLSGTDRETLRFLDDVIILAVHANPDGQELVSNWYMREPEPEKRSTSGIPRLYQKYVGHDNNRDFYLSAQPESTNMNRVMYREWFPQIVYNHHQTGPAGTVLFAPPFRGPFNYVFDPLVPLGIDLVGAAMHSRFAAEGKAGATMTRGASYSTWWNGGLRTTPYFHNMIGLLTETIGNPTPIEIPFRPERQLPSVDLPYPIAPQTWHFRQSIEYSMTANRAVLDVASKHREDFLFNLYRMGKNSIDRGNRDHWTTYPRRIDAVRTAIAAGRSADDEEPPSRGSGSPQHYFDEVLRDPELRDPRGFILPSDQPDFLTATRFMNSLIKLGVTVHRATRDFDVAGTQYPEGSYVVKSAQAFRPHVLDMFEPQDHPDDIPYPGGPPIAPYDSAGWTLALQMGVEFDRILEGFDGPFERVQDLLEPPEGRVVRTRGAAGYLLSHRTNDAFIAVNRLLKANESVYWLEERVEVDGVTHGPGTMYVPAGSSTRSSLESLASELGLSFHAVARTPAGDALKLRPVRIGLWDRYGGSMPSGWLRWVFEQYEFPFEVVYPQALDAGDLRSQFDVLVFVSGAIPSPDGSSGQRFRGTPPTRETVPEEFHDWLGNVTTEKTVPKLREFLEAGGTILTIGSSTNLAYHLDLPVTNALVEKLQGGGEQRLASEKYYVPGSVLEMSVDPSSPLAYGIGDRVNVYFNNSPVFRLDPDAAAKGVRPVTWFSSDAPLKSGWAWGQHYLEGGVGIAEAAVGDGKMFLYGPEVTFRAQPHGTFKFVFNGIYYGTAESVTMPGPSTSEQQ